MIARALLWLALAGAARGQGMPDLVLNTPALQANAHEELKSIGATDCTLQPSDACVDGPGIRKLLRFSVLAVNKGDADLFVGTPSADDPRFVFSQCHNHFHFESFARYELRQVGGATVVKSGRKRSFCIEDLRTDPDNPQARACTSDPDCDGHGKCANGICQYELRDRPLELSRTISDSIGRSSPRPTPKKSPSGQSTLGVALPS